MEVWCDGYGTEWKWDPTNRKYGLVVNPGTKRELLEHQELPYDKYIQQQMLGKITQLLEEHADEMNNCGVLADDGTVYVDAAASGCESGTRTHPARTIQRGLTLVRDGGVLNIHVGNYPSITIEQPVTLQAVDGVVTIGQ